MTRSTLVHLFRRAYQTAQLAATLKTSTSEVEGILKEQKQATLSRRQLLQAGAFLSGTAILHPDRLFRSVSPVASDSKVLIVGAGIAGLTAAYRLRQAGVPVEIAEASDRVGGRLVSLSHHSNAASTVELGGEFIDTRHTAVRSLAAELGLEMADLKAADVGLDTEIFYFQGQKVSHGAIAATFAPLAERIVQDLRRLGKRELTYRTPNPAAAELDRLSLAEYLAQADADPVLDQLVRAAYVTEFGRDAEDQSCLNMLYLIGNQTGQWSTYGISDERWHVIGGNEQLPRQLAKSVEDAIATGLWLESIREQSDGRYLVSFRQGSGSVERTYDRILLTLPFSVLRLVSLDVELPPAKRQAIAELGYGTGTKLSTPYAERIWRTRYDSTVYIYADLPFQNTWESARYTPGPGGWLTDLRGGTEGVILGSGEADDHARQLAQDLEPLFPGISQVERGRSLRAFWAAEPYAFGSYSCYRPGQWTQFGGVEGERVGNLWFAGEHCAMESQGYMNGACETAELAALDILQDMGLTVAANLQRDRVNALQG